MPEARPWYAHLTGLDGSMFGAGSIPLDRLAALAASRILSTSAGGIIQVNAALTSGLLVRADGTGSLADSAGVLNADIGASAAIAFSKLAALTASRALVTNGSGEIVTSGLTAAQLAAVVAAVTDTGRIDLTLSSNSLSADLVAGGIRTVDLGSNVCGFAQSGNDGGSAGLGTSYADFGSHTYTPRRAGTNVLVIGIVFNGYVSGTTTVTIRRGTTVIGSELTYLTTGQIIQFCNDTGHGGSATTWNISVKNSTPAGTATYGKVAVVEFA